jgi:hypothetical protein
VLSFSRKNNKTTFHDVASIKRTNSFCGLGFFMVVTGGGISEFFVFKRLGIREITHVWGRDGLHFLLFRGFHSL